MTEVSLTTIKILFAVVQISFFLMALTSFEYLKRLSIAYVSGFILLITLTDVFMFPVNNFEFNSVLYFVLIWLPIVIVFLMVAKYKDGRFVFSLVMADSAVLAVYGFDHWISHFLNSTQLAYFSQFIAFIIIFFIINRVYRPKLLIAQDTLSSNWLMMCIRPTAQNILLHITLVNNTEITPLVETIIVFLYVLLFVQYVVTYRSFGNFIEFTQLKKKNEQLIQQINTRLEDNKDLLRKEDALKLIRHDLRHHMTNLFLLISNNETKQALEYIEQFQHDISFTQTAQYCENVVINSLIAYYVKKAQKSYIKVTTLIQLPQDIEANDIDLSVILSNALENAINANLKIEDSAEREISIRCKTTKKDIQIKIQNPNFSPVEFENGLPVSHVKDHGFGTKSMLLLARKFYGTVEFDQSENMFTCIIYLLNKKAKN